MSRRPRLCPAGVPQHIVQRGNNRQACFATENDLKAYAHWLQEGSEKCHVSIHAWVFMTNHVHLLATPQKNMAVARLMQYVGRLYVQYFNKKHQRSGTLWEGRYHSSLIQDDAYLLRCQRYIELNPVRAGMVDDPANYSWSSYRANGLGIQTKLMTPHPLYTQLGGSNAERMANYRDLFQTHIDGAVLQEIRYALNHGLVLGTEQFKTQVEELTGRRVRPRKRGRRPKQRNETGIEEVS